MATDYEKFLGDDAGDLLTDVAERRLGRGALEDDEAPVGDEVRDHPRPVAVVDRQAVRLGEPAECEVIAQTPIP